MYKVIILIIVIAIFVSIDSIHAIEYKPYKSILYGFIIDYPSDWLVEEYPYYSHSKVSFIESAMDDEYKEFMLIGVEELGRELTLEEYSELIIRQQNRSLKNLTIIDQSDFMFANSNGRMIQYKGIDVNISIRGDIIFTIINGIAYMILTASQESKYEDYKSIFEHMINSFKIDKSIIPKPISKRYVDDGIDLIFPDGWKGLISKIDNDTIIRMKPSLQSDTLMNIIVTDIASIDHFSDQIKDMLDDNCNIKTANFININGSKALEIEHACMNNTKVLLFTTNTKLIIFELVSSNEYDIRSFDDTIRLSKISNLTNVNEYLDDKLNGLPERLDEIEDINIPKDWNVFKRRLDGIDVIYTTPNGSNFVNKNYTSISIIKSKLDINSLLALNNLNDYECKTSIIHHIYRDHTLDYRIFCNKEGYKAYLEVLNTKIDGKESTVSYLTTFEDGKYDDAFNTILEDIIDPTLLFSIKAVESPTLINDEYRVIINNTIHSIRYGYLSNTKVVDVDFDPINKEVIFNATTDKQSILVIEQTLLEGPYIVRINDDIFNINSHTDRFAIVYDDDAIITIVGSNVIPEFPIPLLLITTLISIPIIITRLWRAI